MYHLLIVGDYEFTKLSMSAVPDITDNQVQVITISPALGAPDVNSLLPFQSNRLTATCQLKKSGVFRASAFRGH